MLWYSSDIVRRHKIWKKNLPLFFFWIMYILRNVKIKWDFFFQFLWPSQNIWTLISPLELDLLFKSRWTYCEPTLFFHLLFIWLTPILRFQHCAALLSFLCLNFISDPLNEFFVWCVQYVVVFCVCNVVEHNFLNLKQLIGFLECIRFISLSFVK